jgi:FkbM family methyltransferase
MKLKKPILKAASWAAGILPAPVKKFFYKCPLLARTLRNILNAAAPDGLTEISIAAGPAHGLNMLLDLKSEKDYWLGTYETELQNAASKLIYPGSIVYDIGANIGYVSLFSAMLSGLKGKIFSFEALPANIERLKANVSINKLDSRITVTHAAVIENDQPVTFLTHESGAMGKAIGSAGRDEKYSGQITVPGVTIDSFVYDQNHLEPDLVKLDIEGGEGSALVGMKRLLTDKQPVFLIELHGEKAARQVWDHLLQFDYKIYRMTPAYPQITHIDDLDWKAYIIALPSHLSNLLTKKTGIHPVFLSIDCFAMLLLEQRAS